MPNHRRTLAYLLIQISLLGVGTDRSSSQDMASPFAKVVVTDIPGREIPPSFLGLSHEWGTTMNLMGYSKTGVNEVYRRLLTNLTAYGSNPVDLRIGGNSTDTTGVPSGDRVEPFAELSNALHVRFTLGINLGSGDLALSKKQVEFYLSRMPVGSIEAMEIGNEPDHYPKRRMRQNDYNIDDFITDFDAWSAAILPLLPKGMLVVGPSWGAPQMITHDAEQFLSREATRLFAFSVHYYAGNPASNPPTDYLLRPAAAISGPTSLESAIAAAHEHHVLFRLNEVGSFYGYGVHGISDAFSAALWSTDTMFEYASRGVDGVNWEADGSNYCTPFSFIKGVSQGMNTFTLKSVAPLYYGLLLFQAATGYGARLLPVKLDSLANVKAWATVDKSGITRMVIINKDIAKEGNISVELPGYKRASILRLLAPSYNSLNGITFGGQTFDGSADGRLLGRQKSDTVRRNHDSFQIWMPTTSAALVIFGD